MVAQMVKNLPAVQKTQVPSLEQGMATHSSILAWRIPWTGAWQAIVCGVTKSQHDWATHTLTFTGDLNRQWCDLLLFCVLFFMHFFFFENVTVIIFISRIQHIWWTLTLTHSPLHFSFLCWSGFISTYMSKASPDWLLLPQKSPGFSDSSPNSCSYRGSFTE